MSQSRRAARVERHHKRAKPVSLNLTSLMDIFTILVFFLLVNSQSQQPPSAKDLTLPLSTASKEPKEMLTVMVNKDFIIVQGEKVANTQEVLEQKEDTIPTLLAELQRQAARNKEEGISAEKAKEISIMGDQKIPYKLLRKLMFTCTQSGFSKISLAVMRKAGDKEDG